MTRKIVFPDAPGSWDVFFNDERISRLNSIGDFSLDFSDSHPSTETLIERIGDAEGMISGWGVSNEVLAALPNLKVISFVGLGVGSFFDLAEANRRGVTITHGLSAGVLEILCQSSNPEERGLTNEREIRFSGIGIGFRLRICNRPRLARVRTFAQARISGRWALAAFPPQ